MNCTLRNHHTPCNPKTHRILSIGRLANAWVCQLQNRCVHNGSWAMQGGIERQIEVASRSYNGIALLKVMKLILYSFEEASHKEDEWMVMKMTFFSFNPWNKWLATISQTVPWTSSRAEWAWGDNRQHGSGNKNQQQERAQFCGSAWVSPSYEFYSWD